MSTASRADAKGRSLKVGSGAIFAALGLSWAGAAAAYIGDSFVQIPDQTGHWHGRDHRQWIRAEASEWTGRIRKLNSGAADALAGDKLFFGGPNAPKPGNMGKLVLMVAKDSPDRAALMALCTSKTTLPQITYSESSDRARPFLELGPRPAEFPAFWDYRLKTVQVADCPYLDGAADQAFVITFKDIDWLNYDPNRSLANKVVVTAKDLPDVRPVEETARSKVRSYLITWIAPATLSTPDQCPAMNAKPTDADVFRYLSPEEAAALRAKNGEKGVTAGLDSERRGPHRLDVDTLPGIVPDPGFREPQTSLAAGIDLDGDGGRGQWPDGVRAHKVYVSPDGRKGIDNQLLTVMGCVPGFQGKNGYRNQTSNARRADGNVTTLIQISGIRDGKNDNDVDVSIIYSMDKPIRNIAGTKFIPYYTFRPTGDPNFSLYNVRLHGRIVNGVLTTDPVAKLQANLGQDPLFEMFKARMRFEFLADGSMKGVLAGYLDWKRIADAHSSGYSEGLFGYQEPGLYYALKRNADGLKDPVTGEYDGISAVYEIDAVPAYLTPAGPTVTAADKDGSARGKGK